MSEKDPLAGIENLAQAMTEKTVLRPTSDTLGEINTNTSFKNETAKEGIKHKQKRTIKNKITKEESPSLIQTPESDYSKVEKEFYSPQEMSNVIKQIDSLMTEKIFNEETLKEIKSNKSAVLRIVKDIREGKKIKELSKRDLAVWEEFKSGSGNLFEIISTAQNEKLLNELSEGKSGFIQHFGFENLLTIGEALQRTSDKKNQEQIHAEEALERMTSEKDYEDTETLDDDIETLNSFIEDQGGIEMLINRLEENKILKNISSKKVDIKPFKISSKTKPQKIPTDHYLGKYIRESVRSTTDMSSEDGRPMSKRRTTPRVSKNKVELLPDTPQKTDKDDLTKPSSEPNVAEAIVSSTSPKPVDVAEKILPAPEPVPPTPPVEINPIPTPEIVPASPVPTPEIAPLVPLNPESTVSQAPTPESGINENEEKRTQTRREYRESQTEDNTRKLPEKDREKVEMVSDFLNSIGAGIPALKRQIPEFKDIENDPAKMYFVGKNIEQVWYKHIEEEAHKKHQEYVQGGSWWGAKVKRNFWKSSHIEKRKREVKEPGFQVDAFKDEIANLIHIANAGPKLVLLEKDSGHTKKKKGEEPKKEYELIAEYMSSEFLAANKKNFSQIDAVGEKNREGFNRIATRFASMPTASEALHLRGDKKKEYDRVKAEYDKARLQLLNDLCHQVITEEDKRLGREAGLNPEIEARALVTMNNLDFQVKIHQSLIHHPEVEQELLKLEKTKPFLAATVQGMLAGGVGGIGLRATEMATRGFARLTAVGALGITAIPLAGAIVGGAFGYKKGKEAGRKSLIQRDKDIREGKREANHGELTFSFFMRGRNKTLDSTKKEIAELEATVEEKTRIIKEAKKDELKEVMEKISIETDPLIKEALIEQEKGIRKEMDQYYEELYIKRQSLYGKEGRKQTIDKHYMTAEVLGEKLKKLTDKLNLAIDRGDDVKDINEIKDALKARIYFTQKKLSDDSVIFGTHKQALGKYAFLMEDMADAEVELQKVEESIKKQEKIVDGKVVKVGRTRIEALQRVLQKDHEEIKEKQRLYVRERGIIGAGVGVAGAAVGSYVGHELSEAFVEHGGVEFAKDILKGGSHSFHDLGSEINKSLEFLSTFTYEHLPAFTKAHGNEAGKKLGDALAEMIGVSAKRDVVNTRVLSDFISASPSESTTTNVAPLSKVLSSLKDHSPQSQEELAWINRKALNSTSSLPNTITGEPIRVMNVSKPPSIEIPGLPENVPAHNIPTMPASSVESTSSPEVTHHHQILTSEKQSRESALIKELHKRGMSLPKAKGEANRIMHRLFKAKGEEGLKPVHKGEIIDFTYDKDGNVTNIEVFKKGTVLKNIIKSNEIPHNSPKEVTELYLHQRAKNLGFDGDITDTKALDAWAEKTTQNIFTNNPGFEEHLAKDLSNGGASEFPQLMHSPDGKWLVFNQPTGSVSAPVAQIPTNTQPFGPGLTETVAPETPKVIESSVLQEPNNFNESTAIEQLDTPELKKITALSADNLISYESAERVVEYTLPKGIPPTNIFLVLKDVFFENPGELSKLTEQEQNAFSYKIFTDNFLNKDSNFYKASGLGSASDLWNIKGGSTLHLSEALDHETISHTIESVKDLSQEDLEKANDFNKYFDEIIKEFNNDQLQTLTEEDIANSIHRMQSHN